MPTTHDCTYIHIGPRASLCILSSFSGMGLGLIGGAGWKMYHMREKSLIAQANAQADAAIAKAAAAAVYKE